MTHTSKTLSPAQAIFARSFIFNSLSKFADEAKTWKMNSEDDFNLYVDTTLNIFFGSYADYVGDDEAARILNEKLKFIIEMKKLQRSGTKDKTNPIKAKKKIKTSSCEAIGAS